MSTATTGGSLTLGWSARGESARSPGWADPLGLRRDAATVSDGLVPVFRQRHRTVEQFGLLCYGMGTTAADKTDRLLAVSRMWTHACVDKGLSWPGERRALHRAGDATLDLAEPLMDDEVRRGLWASNRGAASRLGLLQLDDAERGSAPEGYGLTPRGRELARAFKQTFIAQGRGTALAGRLTSRACARKDLAWLRVTNTAGRRQLAEVLTDCLEDLPDQYELGARLRQVLDAARDRSDRLGLSVSVLDRHRSILTREQRDALDRAKELNRAVRSVEAPFRRWMSDPSLRQKPPKGLWDAPFWSRLTWIPTAERVRAAGARDGWEGLRTLAEELAVNRDVSFPQRGEVRSGWEAAPRERYRLDTFTELLDAGLMAR